MTEPFRGAKIALLSGPLMMTILRDDIPGIAWPGYWDMPGGGREDTETPVETALRETREELGLSIDASWVRHLAPHPVRGRMNWFLVAECPALDPSKVVFGDEGQCWELAPIHSFFARRAVPGLQDRLARYLAERTRG